MVDKVMTWLDDRLGLTSIYNVVLDRKVPKVNWWYTLGSASLVLFLLRTVLEKNTSRFPSAS